MVNSKKRYFIQLSFLGTNYHGWQFQPNAISIQQVVEQKIKLILNEDVELTGAGRTDAGVHASFFIAHFDSSSELLNDTSHLIYKINSILPHDIAIQSIVQVVSEAHARFDAQFRTYTYYISKAKDPFRFQTSWQFFLPLNVHLMNEASSLLLQTDDFTSFSRLHSDNKTNICKVTLAQWIETPDSFIFTIVADRFLRNMVRAIVGTLVDVGLNKISLMDFDRIIRQKNRGAAGKSAPAQGLFLSKITYPTRLFLSIK